MIRHSDNAIPKAGIIFRIVSWITDIGKWFTDVGKSFTDIGK